MITTGPQFDRLIAELATPALIVFAEQTVIPASTAFADLIPIPKIDDAAMNAASPTAMNLRSAILSRAIRSPSVAKS
jgi:hypothetical protein